MLDLGESSYALLSRLPVSSRPVNRAGFSLDLHTLGTPPTFILSQDQTLHKIVCPALVNEGGKTWQPLSRKRGRGTSLLKRGFFISLLSSKGGKTLSVRYPTINKECGIKEIFGKTSIITCHLLNFQRSLLSKRE